jgi:hypothetical protein
LAVGRKAWLFAGSDRGADRAAAVYTLIMTVKLNGVYPQPRLADVFPRIPSMPQSRLHELPPWNWKLQAKAAATAQAARNGDTIDHRSNPRTPKTCGTARMLTMKTSLGGRL